MSGSQADRLRMTLSVNASARQSTEGGHFPMKKEAPKGGRASQLLRRTKSRDWTKVFVVLY